MALAVDLLLHKLQQLPKEVSGHLSYVSLKDFLEKIQLKLHDMEAAVNNGHRIEKAVKKIKITSIQAVKKIDLNLAIQESKESKDWEEMLKVLDEDFGAHWVDIPDSVAQVPVPVAQVPVAQVPVPVAQVPVPVVDVAVKYSLLPIHSRACFLYFGVFPSDNEIPVWKLILLWIAEGFVPKSDGLSLEDSAYEMLNKFVKSGMVHHSQMSLLGKIKTCRIDHAQRQFCLAKAAEEFFWKINLIDEGDIAQDGEPVFQSKTSMYSLLFNDCTVVKSVNNYIFLKYVEISGTFTDLPESVTNLIHLQTLIVETTSPTLDIRANIWKMLALRHVHTRATTVTNLPSPPRRGKKNGNLLTLSTVSAQSCKNVISRTPNVTKLGIRGDLAFPLSKITRHLVLNKLKNLEKLKLLDADSSAKSLLDLSKIIFPPNLRKLTLENTSLKWTDMKVLAKIPQLEVLKLKDGAFKGPEWNMTKSNQRFGNLKVLHIGKTNLKEWQASKDQNFPCIESIVVVEPETKSAVPSDLRGFLPGGIEQQR